MYGKRSVRRAPRKSYKKKSNYKKRSVSYSQIAKIAKRVSLRQAETKHHTVNYGNYALYHNVSRRVDTNLLSVQQGTGDTGNNSRIGDEVIPVGVKLYLQFEQMIDRPNVQFKVWVLKGREGEFGSSVPLKIISGNNLMDPIDTEKCSVVKSMYFKFNQNNIVHDGDVAVNKRVVNCRKVWIPLKRSKYTYEGDNNSNGKWWNMPLYVCAYDASNTLVTDHISNLHIASEFFFKDP